MEFPAGGRRIFNIRLVITISQACSSSCLSVVYRCSACNLLLCCTLFCNFPLLHFMDFSLHFSFSSEIRRLSCGIPCFFVSALFDNISCLHLTMCPPHFIRLLTVLPTMQALVPYSFLLHSPSLHSLYTGYSPYPVVLCICRPKMTTSN